MKGFMVLLRLSWISLISKIKSFFQSNNTHHQTTSSNGNEHKGKISVGNKIETKGNEEDIWYDALEEQESGKKERELDEEEFFDVAEGFGKQKVGVDRERYESNKFYSAKNLREVQDIDHSNTFAVAIFEHSIDKSPSCNDSNYQLVYFKLNDDRESRACTLTFQNNTEISSDHIRLYIPFYFESKKQESINHLFEYRNKNNDISMPGIIMLLEKPNSFNLNCNFGLKEWIYRSVWNKIKESEAKKSSRISKALFPTFTIDVSKGQNLILSIDKSAIPKSIEDLKDEKPTVKAILAIPGASLIISGIINSILDKVIGKKEKESFHIRDILIDGETINKLQNNKVEVEEKVDHNPEYFEVVGLENLLESKAFQPNM